MRLNISAKVLASGLLFVAACSKGGESGGGTGGGATAAATAFPVDTANAATVTGRVAFTGAKPAMARIDMSEEATCAAKHAGGAFSEQVVVNDNGTLRNVFVYVKSGVPANLQFPVPSAAVEIDQNGCQYTPHVFGIQAGQTLNIKNEDGLLHNIKALPTTNRPFNISQPSNMTTPKTFASAEVMVPLQCNVHSWMNAFVGVRSDPYYAVTGADGTFSISRLPPGTYTIEAWQEKYGVQTQTVTVAAKESKAITFTFHS
jgi:plastocyanin